MQYSTLAFGLLVVGAIANPLAITLDVDQTPVSALTNTIDHCFWSGTAPFCEGACPANWRTEKEDKSGDGAQCATGTKRYCCRTFNLDNCYWSGTAPFCEGGCNTLEEYEASRDGCGDGKCCATGLKSKCCKPA